MSEMPRSSIEDDWNNHYGTLKENGMLNSSRLGFSNYSTSKNNRKKRPKSINQIKRPFFL